MHRAHRKNETKFVSRESYPAFWRRAYRAYRSFELSSPLIVGQAHTCQGRGPIHLARKAHVG